MGRSVASRVRRCVMSDNHAARSTSTSPPTESPTTTARPSSPTCRPAATRTGPLDGPRSWSALAALYEVAVQQVETRHADKPTPTTSSVCPSPRSNHGGTPSGRDASRGFPSVFDQRAPDVRRSMRPPSRVKRPGRQRERQAANAAEVGACRRPSSHQLDRVPLLRSSK
jgi:hypothetical protein